MVVRIQECANRPSKRRPRGARQRIDEFPRTILVISIHAPREGRDPRKKSRASGKFGFNPRAPRGARQVTPERRRFLLRVSIHAPREGRDPRLSPANAGEAGFNPRAPRGARRPVGSKSRPPYWFQSTRPARGATSRQRFVKRVSEVSIHAPREGRDRGRLGGAAGRIVSIHAPREGRDISRSLRLTSGNRFQSTRPARGATARSYYSVKLRGKKAGRANLARLSY